MCRTNSSCSYAGYKFTQTKILSISETFMKQTVSTFLHSVSNIPINVRYMNLKQK